MENCCCLQSREAITEFASCKVSNEKALLKLAMGFLLLLIDSYTVHTHTYISFLNSHTHTHTNFKNKLTDTETLSKITMFRFI